MLEDRDLVEWVAVESVSFPALVSGLVVIRSSRNARLNGHLSSTESQLLTKELFQSCIRRKHEFRAIFTIEL